jgi:hypothetical protein
MARGYNVCGVINIKPSFNINHCYARGLGVGFQRWNNDPPCGVALFVYKQLASKLRWDVAIWPPMRPTPPSSGALIPLTV